MSTTHLSAAQSRPPTADARLPPPPSGDEPDARHPPPRSFSQPQLPYHFQPPTTPGSAAPSLHHLTLPRHLTPAMRDSFAPMCASARTSYTRVDATATVPGTPRAEAEQLQDLPVLAAAEGTAEGADNEKETETDGAGDAGLPALPQAVLTFLLVSGRRRTMAFDPETTIGRMKELVWNAWPNEWQDERPPAPSYFRVLYLGKILQDDDTLAKWSFPLSHPQSSASAAPQNPTIVHLSIRAHAPAMEDTPKKRRGGGAGEEGEGAGCCGCVVC